MKFRFLFLILLAFFITACPSDPGSNNRCNFGPAQNGQLTFYTTSSVYGSCGFTSAASGSNGIIAVSPADMEGDFPCGSCVKITSATGSITTVVGDLCPTCAVGEIDAQSGLANYLNNGSVDGRHTITYEPVPCPTISNIQIRFEGSNPWYLKLMISGERTPIATVSIETEAGTVSAVRQSGDQGWVVASSGASFGSGPYTVIMTDIFGEEVRASNVLLSSSAAPKATDVQFSECH